MELQRTIIAIYWDATCEKIMETFNNELRDTREWALDRIVELCNQGNFKDVMNGDAIRQEFNEWIVVEEDELDVLSMEYLDDY